jgi:diguanylate cyclase (GGDEF)-like protein
MSYSVSIAEDQIHNRGEALSLIAGYLLLLTLGISLTNISYNKLTRSARSKRIYEEKLQDQYASQKAISSILKLAISNRSINDKLAQVLEIVTGMSWLRSTARGYIFSANGDSLILSASKGITQAVKQQCSQVKIGDCLCGAAVNKRSVQYTPHVDHHKTEIACKAEPHGHYSVPILYEEKCLGLLALYVEEGHHETSDEIKFLTSIGNSLGTMIHKSQMEQQLHYDAHHDRLTGLANRALLAERVSNSMARAQREPNSHFSLLFIDLDRFKHINDSLGHTIGDNILIETAMRLQQLLRQCDTIARLGGDEFVILLDHIESLNSVYHTAGRIHQTIEKNIHIGSYDLHITCSIGIAYHNSSYSIFEQMLRDADIAMYIAKASGTDKTVTFDQQMHQMALNTLSTESALRLAVEQQELIAYFQPIYSTYKKRFVGAEALIRWNRNGKITMPSEFIEIAEDSGIIIMLGEYVLHEACKMISQLVASDSDDQFYVSVNVSVKQMLNRNFIEILDRVLEQHATPTRHLRLEITESLFADNSPLITEHLTKIKARGIKLLIDDFGTGYSSLSFLHNHPFDCVKIDRSFISRICATDSSQSSRKLVKTISQLAKNLDMSIVAEGVEDEQQLDYLSQIGCEFIQGYLFSEPLAPELFFQTYTTQPQQSFVASHLRPVTKGKGHHLGIKAEKA